MGDLEAPSFSLGLDFDADSGTQISPNSNATAGLGSIAECSEDVELQVADSDPDTGPKSPRILRRLRRGLVARTSSTQNEKLGKSCLGGSDDEIEEFSPKEDLRRENEPSAHYHSVCSTSKVPLRGHGVFMSEKTTQWNIRKKTQVSDATLLRSSESGCKSSEFPRLKVSPLRRFQLIDSDSDDPVVAETSGKPNINDTFSKPRQALCSQNVNINAQKEARGLTISKNVDFWRDFSSVKSFCVPTPAFDDVCEEYFNSLKKKNVPRKVGVDIGANINAGDHQKRNSLSAEQEWSLAEPRPPAHCYFFHDDPKIQNLVRSRLPNFFPLCVANSGTSQPQMSVINYMSQFGNVEASKSDATRKGNAKRSSTRARRETKKPRFEEVPNSSGGWMNPKSGVNLPKDAGKRRVHADGQSVGHWYTAQDGKKVYVSKSGQELTGQAAYRHYKKESGGFRRSKKKTSSKKKKGKG